MYTDLNADDTTVYEILSNMQTLERNFQKSLLILNKLFRENAIVVHVDLRTVVGRQVLVNSFCPNGHKVM